MKDHSCSWIIWSIIVILALALGLYAGHQISRAISDIKIMDLEVQLETANASLAEVNVELAFWKSTLRGLADGKQFEAVDLKATPSTGD